MFKNFKWAHPLFYIPLFFLVFPVAGVFVFNYPVWTLWLTLIFTLAYLYIIHFEQPIMVLICLLVMCFYVSYMTLHVNIGMMWFNFYLSNLLIYRLKGPLKSFFFTTFIINLLLVTALVFIGPYDISEKALTVIVMAVTFIMMYGLTQEVRREEQEEEVRQKNAYINLLMAENERNRIGRDLHDTLGHVFAMMTIKTELALKQLDQGKLEAVKKELTDLQTSSRQSISESLDR